MSNRSIFEPSTIFPFATKLYEKNLFGKIVVSVIYFLFLLIPGLLLLTSAIIGMVGHNVSGWFIRKDWATVYNTWDFDDRQELLKEIHEGPKGVMAKRLGTKFWVMTRIQNFFALFLQF